MVVAVGSRLSLDAAPLARAKMQASTSYICYLR